MIECQLPPLLLEQFPVLLQSRELGRDFRLSFPYLTSESQVYEFLTMYFLRLLKISVYLITDFSSLQELHLIWVFWFSRSASPGRFYH